MTTFMTYKEECEALRQRVAELEARLERINPLLDEAADKIDTLEKKRDELLAALEGLASKADELCRWDRRFDDVLDAADSAIASVKGSAA